MTPHTFLLSIAHTPLSISALLSCLSLLFTQTHQFSPRDRSVYIYTLTSSWYSLSLFHKLHPVLLRANIDKLVDLNTPCIYSLMLGISARSSKQTPLPKTCSWAMGRDIIIDNASLLINAKSTYPLYPIPSPLPPFPPRT